MGLARFAHHRTCRRRLKASEGGTGGFEAAENLDQPRIVKFWWPESAILRLVGNDSGATLGVCGGKCGSFRKSVQTAPAVGPSGGDPGAELYQAADVEGEVGHADLRAGSGETDGSDGMMLQVGRSGRDYDVLSCSFG